MHLNHANHAYFRISQHNILQKTRFSLVFNCSNVFISTGDIQPLLCSLFLQKTCKSYRLRTWEKNVWITIYIYDSNHHWLWNKMAATICENTRFPCDLGSDYGKFVHDCNFFPNIFHNQRLLSATWISLTSLYHLWKWTPHLSMLLQV